MGIIVQKFGGSSVADNEKLQTVANKTIKLYEEENNILKDVLESDYTSVLKALEKELANS